MSARLTWGLVLRWLVVALVLAGLPVLLHGCHGDEDIELLVRQLRNP